jgi:murein DD-endopeptidase MepM/ murein hydrolase activator NlpD
VKFYRFQRANGEAEYFDEFGKNIKGFLLRTPIDGARITSLFGLRRHPVLGYTRAHQGIDFGAGTGTPIVAAGDGVVLEARRWGGYGNWLRIRHNGGWDTGYGHISRYASGIRPGMHVRQGQVVAYVGSTGLATGPHLHYEVWKNGQRQNPIGAKIRKARSWPEQNSPSSRPRRPTSTACWTGHGNGNWRRPRLATRKTGSKPRRLD